jgi:hypothetical protein
MSIAPVNDSVPTNFALPAPILAAVRLLFEMNKRDKISIKPLLPRPSEEFRSQAWREFQRYLDLFTTQKSQTHSIKPSH